MPEKQVPGTSWAVSLKVDRRSPPQYTVTSWTPSAYIQFADRKAPSRRVSSSGALSWGYSAEGKRLEDIHGNPKVYLGEPSRGTLGIDPHISQRSPYFFTVLRISSSGTSQL
ncbi:uncharacterized protein AAES06_011051 isoform 1-T1 [Glossophaga mutica]